MKVCVPSPLFDLKPNYGGGNEDNGDLLQNVPCKHCYTQCPQPCSRSPLTHTSAGVSWTLTASLGQSLVGSCSPLLGPGMHKVLFVPLKSLSPQSCVSSGGSAVGLMLTSSKRACATPGQLHPEPLPLPQSLLTPTSSGDTQTQFCLSLCGVSEPWCAQGMLEPSEHLWQVQGLILNMISSLLMSCWGSPLSLDVGHLLKVTPVDINEV